MVIEMNKKGFTLSELLGVVVVLAIIIGVAMMSTTTIMNKSKNKLYSEMEETLKDVTVTYIISSNNSISGTNNTSDSIKNAKCVENSSGAVNCVGKCEENVSVATLKDEGLFEDNKNYCSGSVKVKVVCNKAAGKIVEDYEVTVPENTCGN